MHEATPHESSPDAAAEGAAPLAVIVHLSGDQRGRTQRLSGSTLTIGTDADMDVRLPPDPGPTPLPLHATLFARDGSYELTVLPGAEVWVNGQPVEEVLLGSGDVMEFGRDGPILRFRIYPPGSKGYKTLYDAFADCVDCARHSEERPVARAARVATGVPWEVATQTSRGFRAAVSVVLVVLFATTVLLARRSLDLERRLAAELARVQGIAELVEATERASLSRAELAGIRAELEASLTAAERRIDSLATRSDRVARVVERTMASTLFLQGAYAFREPETGRFLRLRLDPRGNPIRSPFGDPALTLEGEGPVFEVFYTGTGFVVDEAYELVLTNRHVAVPWAFDESAQGIVQRGFEGVMRRFDAYVPGDPKPRVAQIEVSSTSADIAVLRVGDLPPEAAALPLADASPAPGQEIVVVGYPLGVRALVARTGPEFVEQLETGGATGFWDVAKRLAEGGHIAPLASRGIVGQVTARAVVYDAETTSGGSGGPVIALDGRVVAVNAAILREFGGSNMGVPVAEARALVERARTGPPR